MKKLILFAALGLFGFASCKSATCPAYSQKTDRNADQKVMVKANPESLPSTEVNS